MMKIHVTRFIYRMTLTIILILFPRLLTLSTGGSTIIASVNTDGTQGNAPSRYPSITSDGRYTAFHSSASTLVIGDTNEVDDIFIYDQTNYSTVRVSVDSDGEEADGASQYAHISATGRYIVFESAATNLVDDDTNGKIDIFLRDRDTDDDGIFDEAGEVSTTLISLNATGTSGGNGDSSKPSITPNGRFIVFASVATNLVASDTNGTLDIFVRDRSLNSTALVSVSTSGTQANFMTIFNYPAITSDGRYVAFHSTATNLVGGDTNGGSDIFIHDRDTDVDGTFDEAGNIKTSRVSVTSSGSQSTGGQSFNPSMSASGRYVVFYSYATNLVSTDLNSAGDVFLVDRDTDGNGTYDDVVGHFSITRISKNTVGTEGNAGSSIFMNSISSDGRYAVFQSAATNLVSDDTNGYYDEFLHDNLIGSTVRISVDSDGSQAINGDSFYGAISADGQYVAFHSDAANLVSTDGNGFLDVFLHGNDFTPPQVISITRAGADPTSAASVDFTVTFSESVAGVDGDDFSLFTNGVSGTAISGVSGAGATRTITVNTGSGDGTIRLDLLDDDTITDLLGYVLGGTGPDNGNFSGEEYTVDKTIPIITSDGGGDTASLSIPENSTAVTTVTAMDPNAADTLTYSISGGADGDKFAIDESSGALAFVIAPDYENPTDTGINNGYEVIVRVSDGLLVDSQLIDVAVTNINETPVIQEGDSISRTVSFSLNLTLHATDPDGDTLTWDIAIPADHGDASASGTGISQVIGYTPDLFYLGLDSFEVRVSDGHGHEDTITIHINVDRHFTLLPLVIR
jgi:hypothetical protein